MPEDLSQRISRLEQTLDEVRDARRRVAPAMKAEDKIVSSIREASAEVALSLARIEEKLDRLLDAPALAGD